MTPLLPHPEPVFGPGFGVWWGLGFRFGGLGFRFGGLGVENWGFKFWIWGLGVGVSSLRFEI
jgi:hypothetical protein